MPFTAKIEEAHNTTHLGLLRPLYYKLSVLACTFLLLASCQNNELLGAGGDRSGNLTNYVAAAAESAEAKGDYATAAKHYRTLYNEDAPDAEIALKLTRNMRKSGNAEAAIPLLKKATDKFPGNAALETELGKQYVSVKNPNRAIRVLKKAINASPDNWDALNAYALAMDQDGRHEEAQQFYRKAELLSPNNPIILNNHALSAALSGDLEEARTLIAKAATLPDADEMVQNNKAVIAKFKLLPETKKPTEKGTGKG